MDENGKVLEESASPRWIVQQLGDGYSWNYKNGQLVDGSGQPLLDLNDFWVEDYSDQTVVLHYLEENKYGAVDPSGKVVVPFVYDESLSLFEGFAIGKRTELGQTFYDSVSVGQEGTEICRAEDVFYVNLRCGLIAFWVPDGCELRNAANQLLLHFKGAPGAMSVPYFDSESAYLTVGDDLYRLS